MNLTTQAVRRAQLCLQAAVATAARGERCVYVDTGAAFQAGRAVALFGRTPAAGRAPGGFRAALDRLQARAPQQGPRAAAGPRSIGSQVHWGRLGYELRIERRYADAERLQAQALLCPAHRALYTLCRRACCDQSASGPVRIGGARRPAARARRAQCGAGCAGLVLRVTSC